MNLPARTSAPRHALFFFDFADPLCYLAAVRVPPACQQAGASLTLEPVDGSRFRPVPPSRLADTERLAAAAHVPFKAPPGYPFDSRVLLLTCAFVRDRSGQEAMTAVAERIWQAIWQHGTVPSAALAVEAAAGAAVPAAALEQALQQPGRLESMLDRVTDRATGRGVTELPTLIVGERLFGGRAALELADPRIAAGDSEPRAGGLPDWTFAG